MLRAEGLLTEEPRRGTFVVSITPRTSATSTACAPAIEGAAARLLCPAQDADAIDRLDAAAEAIGQAAATGDAGEVARADLAFHEALCELSGQRPPARDLPSHVPVLRGLLRLDERVMPLDRGRRRPAPPRRRRHPRRRRGRGRAAGHRALRRRPGALLANLLERRRVTRRSGEAVLTSAAPAVRRRGDRRARRRRRTASAGGSSRA